METRIKSDPRRQFLRQSTLWLIALPALVGTEVAQANKADKTDLAYRDKPGANGKSCSTCGSFVAPNECRIVEGSVSPDGWCIAYSQR